MPTHSFSLTRFAVILQLTRPRSLLVHVQIVARRCVAPYDFQMELSIYLLFKVDIENLVRSKVIICRNFHIQPSELMIMPYWEFELTRKECERIAEEEKKKQDEQQDEYQPPNMGQYNRQANQMMNRYQGRMPSTPKIPKL